MSQLKLVIYVLGPVQTNCYIIYHKDTKEAVIVDPADQASYLLEKCNELKLTVKTILLTHGHFDHVTATNELKQKLNIPVVAGRHESDLLKNPALNLSFVYLNRGIEVEATQLVDDNEELDLLGFKWKVIETPGHTAGSVCYWIPDEQMLISGDTLFYESLGRSDPPTGNTAEIIKSITQKLFGLPDYTIVYPGHGHSTTISHEKQSNPVVPYYKKLKG